MSVSNNQLATTLADWGNSLASMNAFANSVNAYQIPANTTLSRVDGTTYDDLVSNYGSVSSQCVMWIEAVGPMIQTVPQIYTINNAGITGFINAAIQDAQALIVNPNDTAALNDLDNQINACQQHIALVQSTTNSNQQELTSFATSFAAEFTSLGTALSDLTTLYADVQSDISSLSSQIDQLNSKITELDYLIPAEMIATGVAAISFATRIPVLMSWNPLVGGILIIGSFIGTAIAEMEEAAQQSEITSMQQTIQNDQAMQTQDNQALVSISSMKSQLTSFQSTMSNLTSSTGPIAQLQTILSEFLTDCANSIADLQQAAKDANSGQMNEALTDLQNAQSDWGYAYQMANSFVTNLTLSINNQNAFVMNNGKVTQIAF
ncbi:hypothetical protein EMM73_19300 [Rheinheimera sediminis]|uniref:hypothetical protein n=1 Tax=Rheinheimera sp. YQF-1 TaxID=2499626 RepID=UPI000FDC49BC|nr:hypothetical protein [Rheinheimera sp. YQF-1]RVT41374.1 hypothetical protein EMM73_19300 [Rheinheimera sp. YQF-1]